VLEAQLAPSPPIALGRAAAEGGATSMLDVSDGLLLDASRIAAASGVGINVYTEALTEDMFWVSSAHPALREVAYDLVLTGGEDHSLLATFPASGPLPAGVRAIGLVNDDAGVVTVDGALHQGTGGWDPYRDWNGSAG
jgi:thiamine-monophosphate kinase